MVDDVTSSLANSDPIAARLLISKGGSDGLRVSLNTSRPEATPHPRERFRAERSSAALLGRFLPKLEGANALIFSSRKVMRQALARRVAEASDNHNFCSGERHRLLLVSQETYRGTGDERSAG